MAYSAPRTWITGETVTAAELNQDVRDNVADVYSRATQKTMLITAVYQDELIARNDTTAIKTITIPSQLNGANLTDADAALYGAGTAGTVSIRLYNITDSQNMLSTNITVDANELSSYTAAVAPVIDTTFDDVATGDRIGIYVADGGGGTVTPNAGARGLDVMLTFTVQS